MRFVVVCYCLLGCHFVGCNRRTDPHDTLASINETNIQRLANLYFTFQSRHDWRGPKDEADFKTFLGSYNPAKLTRIGIDPGKIDELFISENDGAPFKIRYGVTGSAMGSSEPVIFESVGVDGRRLVGFLNMQQQVVEETEYNDLWAGKQSPAGSATNATRQR
jgi:hypothetical protein